MAASVSAWSNPGKWALDAEQHDTLEGSGREPSRESGPSKADDWGLTKKSTVGNGFERSERGWFSDSQSRAHESDSWVSKPTEGRRVGGFERERRGEASNGGGADSGTWGRKKEDIAPLTLSSNGRPRLVLQPRTLPVNPDEKLEAPVIVPKPKSSNPFGQGRPREEVLAEKGQDWKELDQKLDTIKIKETADKVERSSIGGGRSGFGNGRANLPEEKTWRKPETLDSRPGSTEMMEDEVYDEN